MREEAGTVATDQRLAASMARTMADRRFRGIPLDSAEWATIEDLLIRLSNLTREQFIETLRESERTK